MKKIMMAILLLATVTVCAQDYYTIINSAVGEEDWETATGIIEMEGSTMKMLCNGVNSTVIVDPVTYIENETTDGTPYTAWYGSMISDNLIPVRVIIYNYPLSEIVAIINNNNHDDVVYYEIETIQ